MPDAIPAPLLYKAQEPKTNTPHADAKNLNTEPKIKTMNTYALLKKYLTVYSTTNQIYQNATNAMKKQCPQVYLKILILNVNNVIKKYSKMKPVPMSVQQLFQVAGDTILQPLQNATNAIQILPEKDLITYLRPVIALLVNSL